MPSTVITHLLDDAGDRLCNAHDGPAVAALTLLQATCDEDVRYCPTCARAVLAPIVLLGHTRCGEQDNESDDHHLLQAILSLTETPPDLAAEVMRIICPALMELAAYVEQVGGHHD